MKNKKLYLLVLVLALALALNFIQATDVSAAAQFEDYKWGQRWIDTANDLQEKGKDNIWCGQRSRWSNNARVCYNDTILGNRCSVTLNFTPETELLSSIEIEWAFSIPPPEDLIARLTTKYGTPQKSKQYQKRLKRYQKTLIRNQKRFKQNEIGFTWVLPGFVVKLGGNETGSTCLWYTNVKLTEKGVQEAKELAAKARAKEIAKDKNRF
ncbi:MAG: hypothetical protein P9M03_08565 [Candidatus Theseobacter exili]|nr:hypothetical protein [Candidatus Theseobacter exili]